MEDNPVNEAFKQWNRLMQPWVRFGDPRTTTLTGNIITIEAMESKNPSLEKEIVENVASYGKQLGRINDALNVLISLVVFHRDPSKLHDSELQALRDFHELYIEIAEQKGEHVAPTETDLDLLLREIQSLEDKDPPTYKRMMAKLREFADGEQPE